MAPGSTTQGWDGRIWRDEEGDCRSLGTLRKLAKTQVDALNLKAIGKNGKCSESAILSRHRAKPLDGNFQRISTFQMFITQFQGEGQVG
jgi:hypothetical protein